MEMGDSARWPQAPVHRTGAGFVKDLLHCCTVPKPPSDEGGAPKGRWERLPLSHADRVPSSPDKGSLSSVIDR